MYFLNSKQVWYKSTDQTASTNSLRGWKSPRAELQPTSESSVLFDILQQRFVSKMVKRKKTAAVFDSDSDVGSESGDDLEEVFLPIPKEVLCCAECWVETEMFCDCSKLLVLTVHEFEASGAVEWSYCFSPYTLMTRLTVTWGSNELARQVNSSFFGEGIASCVMVKSYNIRTTTSQKFTRWSSLHFCREMPHKSS